MILLTAALATCLTATATPKLPAFHGVAIGSGFKATVRQGPQSVVISGDEAVLKEVEARVDDDGVLHVGLKKGLRLLGPGPVTVTIVNPTLDSVGGSGGATVQAAFSSGRGCALDASGGSHLTIAALKCEKLAVSSSGGSEIEAVGRAPAIAIDASGGSHVTLRQLQSETVAVDASGGSEVRAFASASLTADLSGGSELYVAGKPTARAIEASGGAQLHEVP